MDIWVLAIKTDTSKIQDIERTELFMVLMLAVKELSEGDILFSKPYNYFGKGLYSRLLWENVRE